MNNIVNKIEELNNEWYNFKQQNDERIKQLEHKSHADPLTQQQLQNINNNIENIQQSIKQINLAKQRPAFANAEYNLGDCEHKNAFKSFLRKGIDHNLHKIEAKSLNVQNDSDGGYYVTREIEYNVYNRLKEISAMRSLVNIQNISSDALEIIEDHELPEAGWANELGNIDLTKAVKLSKKVIPVHELYAQPRATQKLIDDAAINIEQWLEEKIVQTFNNLEEIAFIKGDGVNQPRGILTYENGPEWGKIEQFNSGLDGAINYNNLFKFLYSMKDGYRNKASLLMNKQTTFLVRTMKSRETGEYLWCPSTHGSDSLLGMPIIHSDAMPSPVKNALAIAMADFKRAYLIVDRTNIKLMRDPFTNKPFVKFYITKRVGGDVINYDAIKLLRLSA